MEVSPSGNLTIRFKYIHVQNVLEAFLLEIPRSQFRASVRPICFISITAFV